MGLKEKINAFFGKLPFKALAEKKIPQKIREKVPLLGKLILWANHIVCGLVVLLFLVVIISNGDNPKSLTKKTYPLTQQSTKANKLPSTNSNSTGSSNSKSTSIKLSPKEAQFLTLAEKYYGRDLKFWENSVTITDAAKAPGHIARGRSNIKISGSMNSTQLKEVAEAIKNFKNDEKSIQLIRLDLSSVTDLKIVSEATFDGLNLGSIILPEGLEEINQYAFRSTPLFELTLPSSIKKLWSQTFNSTYLTQFAFPVNFESKYNANIDDVFFSNIDSSIVFNEGQELINMRLIKNSWGEIGIGLSGKKLPAISVVIPTSTKIIYCGNSKTPSKDYGESMPINVETLYFYADTPPTVEAGGKSQFFQNVKTIYAPANALKAYEDAYFNITSAKFLALPKDKANVSAWSNTKPINRKDILKYYGRAAAEGKRKAQERDQQFKDQVKKEMQKTGL